MELDVVLLSRIQFALTVMFHYLFPPLSIGLALLMVFMEGMYLRTGDKQYEIMTRFWTKIFAVNFAVGVASGIVMEFQFGTNWSTYSRFVGDVFGSALAAEGVFAFFLESGFLAVLVFGWDRVSPRMHFFSTCMVALGSMFSAIWIVVANSWQQTPAGFHIVGEGLNARAEITDFWAMVFNPSAMHRLGHVILGAWLQASFFVMSIAAYYLLRNRHLDFAKKTFQIGLTLALIASLLIPISGHKQAQAVGHNQPAKLAAYEAHFKSGDSGTPMLLFGWPDVETQTVKGAVAIPGLLSFLMFGDASQPVRALDSFPREDWPPILIPFITYRVMVGIGLLLLAMVLTAAWYWRRGTLFEQRWLLRLFAFAVILPYIANQFGWIAAEVGRQPWVVYGLLRTSDGVSKSVSGDHVLTSIIMFSLIYLLLFVIWLFVTNSKIVQGPEEPHAPAAPPPPANFLEAAAYLADPKVFSLTGGKHES